MKTTALLSLLSIFSVFSAACAGPLVDSDGTLSDQAGSYSRAKETRLLAFLNDQASTTVGRLDKDCDLRIDAAENLIIHRDGPDALVGTQDDDLFGSVAEIDTVGGIGPVSLQRLFLCSEWFAPEPVDVTLGDRVDVVTDLSTLDPTLAGLVMGTLLEEAVLAADPKVDAPMLFESVTVHTLDGIPVRYDVDYAQEQGAGKSLRIRFTLGVDFQIVSTDTLD